MPEKGNFWGDFAAGAFQGYTSEQERHRQILDQQLRQAAQERTTALALAQAGITDPAVFEMMRPQQAPPPGQGTAGGAIVDLLGKLGGRLPGKVGEVAGKLKAPTYQTEAPGISGPEYGALAQAIQQAQTTESETKVRQVVAETIAREQAKTAADPVKSYIAQLLGGGGAAPGGAAPAAEPQLPSGVAGDIVRHELGLPSQLAEQSAKDKATSDADKKAQDARLKELIAVDESGSATPEQDAELRGLLAVAGRSYRLRSDRQVDEAKAQATLDNTLQGRRQQLLTALRSPAISKPKAKSTRYATLRELLRLNNMAGVPTVEDVEDTWGPGGSTTLDAEGLGTLLSIDFSKEDAGTAMAKLAPFIKAGVIAKPQFDAIFVAPKDGGGIGADQQTAELAWHQAVTLAQGGGTPAAAPASGEGSGLPGAPPPATAATRPSFQERIGQLKAQGVSKAEGRKILKQEGYPVD